MTVEIREDNNPITWLNQYGDVLFRFARARVRDSSAAEDLVQETLLAAYRSRKGFSGLSSVQTWLIGIMKHKIMDYYRRLKPEQSDENIEDFTYSLDNLFTEHEKWKVKPGEWSGDPQNLFEGKELMIAIHGCLADLPDRMSLAFTLREREGATTNEISELLHIRKNNCWVILYRARMLLRRCLEVHWFGKKK